MTTIRVEASKTYEVQIGAGLLAQLPTQIRARRNSAQLALVTDSHVAPLYADAVEQSLRRGGFAAARFVFPAGERSKCSATWLELLDFLAAHRFTRTDAIVALGGGVVGDLAGFAAATYLRGVPLIQVPTTLLATVDSSVGGKTAIDLPAGKNLVGAFYQPDLVVCDTKTLDTLPDEIFADGCAEVIKYGILGSPTLLAHLLEAGPAFDRDRVIAECVAMKRDVVDADEQEHGARQLLNLGHTAAHGIEACSNFAVSHGRAVGAGLAIISRAAAARGYCTAETARQVEQVLRRFGLPVTTPFSAAQLTQYALSDKKRAGDTITLIVPREIGRCDRVAVPVSELEDWLEAGLRV